MSINTSSDVRGFGDVEIDVFEATSVHGFPNLLNDSVGGRLHVHVPDDAHSAMSVGENVTLRVRRAGPHRVFAAAD